MRRLLLAGSLLLWAASPGLSASGSDDPRPLPETAAFIEEVRQNLRSDRQLLEQYTFTEKRVEQRLDGKGAVKKTKTDVYEVYPSLESGRMYRQ
mgnify:CR=1 FL=1